MPFRFGESRRGNRVLQRTGVGKNKDPQFILGFHQWFGFVFNISLIEPA